MYDVLVFVYENFWQGDACPESEQLGRKLSAKGFEAADIANALHWLDGLRLATQGLNEAPASEGAEPARAVPLGDAPAGPAAAAMAQSPHAMRVHSVAEQEQLGAECLGFLRFLEDSQVLAPGMREVILDRAMAAPDDGPLGLDELKIIVLMVYWSTGIEPDALVLDELCDDAQGRVAH